MLHCVSPPQNPGLISLRILADDEELSGGGLFFEYDVDAQVLFLEPTCGPSRGGTLMTVIGRHFRDRGQALCQFASIAAMQATVLSKSLLVCLRIVGMCMHLLLCAAVLGFVSLCQPLLPCASIC